MQANTFQEVDEKVQHCMVGLLFPADSAGFGFHQVRRGGENWNRSRSNASSTADLSFGRRRFGSFHCH